ncbi:MAG: ABC transporter permease [Fervidicoccaceae archaeon]|jgi:ABC-type dipeptide/oligopeptide/nickel transport system permease component
MIAAPLWSYIIKRFLLLIPTLLGASVIIFFMIHMLPGDPAQILAGPEATLQDIQNMRIRLGLDKPLPVQYFMFMERLLTWNLGNSLVSGFPITSLIVPRFINTLKLATLSIAISLAIGIVLGIAAALKRNTFIDRVVMIFALLGVSMPVFLLAVLLIVIFSIKLQLFPATVIGSSPSFRHLVLPSLTLGLIGAAPIARMTRSSMVEVLSQEYIKTSEAFGFSRKKIIFVHALRNALIPVVTVAGLNFGYLLAGAVITETVFAYPGLGRLIVDSIFARDYPVVQFGLMMIVALFAIVNTAVDVLYALINPRVRLE